MTRQKFPCITKCVTVVEQFVFKLALHFSGLGKSKWSLCNMFWEALGPEAVKLPLTCLRLLSLFVADSFHQSFKHQKGPVAANAASI
tara:strand:+ start:23614 stop:23874 length:261 start_codon:yes stop_codon:yes gene_type:complete